MTYQRISYYRQIPILTMAPAPIGLDASTIAWAAAVVANGGTVSAPREGLINDLIVGLKNDGIWPTLDRLWILAAENTQSALTDLVGLQLAVANGGPAFNVDNGYTGVDSSTTVYIDTGFNPSTAVGPQFVRDSAHISAWSDTNVQASATGGAILGLYNVTNSTYLLPWYVDNNSYFGINAGQNGVALAAATGHWLASRTGPNTNSGYRNGASVLAINNASVAVLNGNFYILLRNDVGTGPDTGTPNEVSMASIGGGLSPTQITNFYNRLRTYMTAVGVP